MKQLMIIGLGFAATVSRAFAAGMIYSDFIQVRFGFIELHLIEIMMALGFLSILNPQSHDTSATDDEVCKEIFVRGVAVWIVTGFIYLYSMFL